MAECEHGTILEAIETNQKALASLNKRFAVDIADMVWVKKALGVIVWAAAIVSASVLSILGVLVGILVK